MRHFACFDILNSCFLRNEMFYMERLCEEARRSNLIFVLRSRRSLTFGSVALQPQKFEMTFGERVLRTRNDV